MKHILCIIVSIYSIEKTVKHRVEFCDVETKYCEDYVYNNLQELEKASEGSPSELDKIKEQFNKEWCK
jgi:hypothetical protein